MQGWTPKTNFLLRHPLAQPLAENYRDANSPDDQHGGFDIIDQAFGRAFPSELMDELQTNRWIDGPTRGTQGKLKPARTKMDVDMGNLLHSFINPVLAVVNDGSALSKGGFGTRGDESAFITRKERANASFPESHPLLHHLITTIENTACCRLGKSATASYNDREMHEAYFEFDNSLTSVQIAKYPGDGQAGYPRHCDRGAKCLKEPFHGKEQSPKDNSPERLLTFVYYLTPDEWDSELDGGALRMFSPIEKNYKTDAHFDVTPFADRLVVFRSDLIEHQVLPSLRRDRTAITVWLYGRVCQSSNTKHTCLPLRLFGLNDATNNSISADKDHFNYSLPPPLPIPAATGTASKENTEDQTIFVAIPSYRDEETWPTIKSLVETACHPDRVYVGVVFQVDTMSLGEVRSFTSVKGSSVSELSQWSQQTNFRSITLDYRHATGESCCHHQI